MAKTPVILIFDVGKTNKKVLLFNEQYRLVFEESKKFEEIKDEDGFPCEDVSALTEWVKDSFDRLTRNNTHSHSTRARVRSPRRSPRKYSLRSACPVAHHPETPVPLKRP